MRLRLWQVPLQWRSVSAVGLALATATACLPATRSGAPPADEAAKAAPAVQVTWPPVVGAPAGLTAVVGATVIDGTGAPPLPNATVLWRGKRIERVGPAARIAVPSEATVVDGRGLFLLPGFIDVNVHLALGPSPSVAVVAARAQEALRYGVTTLRDTHGPLAVLRPVRDSIRAGKLLAARLLIAGSIVGWNEVGADSIGVGAELATMEADSFRGRINQYLDQGVDFIKYGATQHASPRLVLSERLQRVLVEEVHKRGRIAETHAIELEGLRMALRAGVDLVQHPEQLKERDMVTWVPYPDDLAPLFARHRVICAINPLSEVWFSSIDFILYTNATKLVRAGCPVALATDNVYTRDFVSFLKEYEEAGDPMNNLASTPLRAIQILVRRLGLTPMEALVAATRTGARASGMLDQLGTIEAGKLADLVLWRADPLRDICHVTVEQIAMVFKEGVLTVSAPSSSPRPCRRKPFYEMAVASSVIRKSALLEEEGQFRLTAAQDSAARNLETTYTAQHAGLIDSLYQAQDPLVDPYGAGWQRISGRTGQYAGALRALLTPEQQVVFDRRAGALMKKWAESGYLLAIPGVPSAP